MSNRNNKYYQTLFLLFVFLTIYSLQLNAKRRYVSKTGSSTPPYTSWETAADSIQKCIDICVFGDTIYVANGVYEEQVVMIPGLALIGSGTDSCIVDSRSFPLTNNRTITMKDSCLVKDFYIRTSNNFDYGSGIRAEGQTGIISQNKFSNSNSGVLLWFSDVEVYKNYYFNLRIGINIYNSNSILRKNDIYTLTETGDHGIIITADNSSYKPILDSNYIETRGDGITKTPGTRSTIINNEIKLISGNDGIFLNSSFSDSNWVYNNLIIADLAASGIYTNGSNHLFINNNYIAGNFLHYALSVGPNHTVKNNVITNSEKGVEVWGTQNLVFQYNNVRNNNVSYSGFTPDSTNLSVDPMIVNDDTTQGELDFHLQKYSPLIDAGDPNILDKDGTRSDMGLYGGPYGESYTYQDLAPKSPRGLMAEVADSTITFTWQKNTEADFNHYNLYRDTTSNFTVDSTKLVSSVTDTFYQCIIPAGAESLYFKLTGVDNQGNESIPSEEVTVILVTVKNEWKPINNFILYQNYPNPFNPTTTIGYKLKERAYVKLYVYDVKGELVEVLVNQYQEAGYYEVEFNGDGKTELIKVKNPFVSGVYLCQIIVQSEKGIPVFSDIKKMILLK